MLIAALLTIAKLWKQSKQRKWELKEREEKNKMKRIYKYRTHNFLKKLNY